MQLFGQGLTLRIVTFNYKRSIKNKTLMHNHTPKRQRLEALPPVFLRGINMFFFFKLGDSESTSLKTSKKIFPSIQTCLMDRKQIFWEFGKV